VREILKFGFLLGIVCTISAGTLSLVYSVVDPLIKENERLEAIKKRKAVLPAAALFEPVEKDERTIHVGLDEGGSYVGTAMTVAQRGYAGPIKMTVGIGPDSKLTGLAISKLDQSETPGLGVKITYPDFLDMFQGLSLDEVKLKSNGGGIDAITAATISSRAVVEGVREGMKWYFRSFPDGAALELPGSGDQAEESAVPESEAGGSQ
jgi:electron transport complex protein RnfG